MQEHSAALTRLGEFLNVERFMKQTTQVGRLGRVEI
ncbi:hypothetical protein X945_5977 [Burkholderia pseudomallei ABCPW 107]|nr:hypothetical protein X945_5977 [Burkholderia pseudomallei ABCPW 107]